MELAMETAKFKVDKSITQNQHEDEEPFRPLYDPFLVNYGNPIMESVLQSQSFGANYYLEITCRRTCEK